MYPLRMLVYSHWTDRCGVARKNNWGSRMDYFLTSDHLRSRVLDVKYWSQIAGSDHCPVTLELSMVPTEAIKVEKGGKPTEIDSEEEKKDEDRDFNKNH